MRDAVVPFDPYRTHTLVCARISSFGSQPYQASYILASDNPDCEKKSTTRCQDRNNAKNKPREHLSRFTLCKSARPGDRRHLSQDGLARIFFCFLSHPREKGRTPFASKTRHRGRACQRWATMSTSRTSRPSRARRCSCAGTCGPRVGPYPEGLPSVGGRL